MDRIDSDNHVYIDGKRSFTDNPPGTYLDADWHNNVQEEICNVITGIGIALDSTSQTQLDQAIRAIVVKYRNMVYLEQYSDYDHPIYSAVSGNTSTTATTILIDEAVTLTFGNLTIPSNITLLFEGEGSIALGGYTLTIEGNIIAPPQQIFSGTGTVSLGSHWCYVDWWGTDEDAFDAALNNSRDVRLKPNGTYTITSLAQITTNGTSLTGPGKTSFPKITYTHNAGNIIDVAGSQCKIGGFELYGPGTGGGEVALNVQSAGCRVFDMVIQNVPTAIQDSTFSCVYEGLYIEDCITGVYFQSGDDAAMRSCYIKPGTTGANETCIRVYQKDSLTLTAVHFDTFDYGVWIRDPGAGLQYCRSCVLTGCYFEGCAAAGRELRSDAAGAKIAGGYRCTRFNVLGGHWETGDAVARSEFVTLNTRDSLALMGTNIGYPNDGGGGGSYNNIVDDSAGSANTRVFFTNTYIDDNTKVLSNDTAKVVDLTAVTLEETGITTFDQAMREKEVNPTYGANITIDLSLGNSFFVEVTDGLAWTVQNPTNAGQDGQEFTIIIYNNSGAGMGLNGFQAAYLFDSGTAPTTADALNGEYYLVTFRVAGGGTVFLETSRRVNVA